MSTTTFTHEFNTESFKGKVSFPTGIFIDGEFSAGSEKTTIEYVPTDGLPTSTSLICIKHTSQCHRPL
jgi:aldehyde dehydrogenase (NAD+)